MKGKSRPNDEAIDANFATIMAWEESQLQARSGTQHLSDWITARAGQGNVLVAHVIWFAVPH